ncbi:sodium/glutamate symporter [Halomonas sp. H10-59]|uniref:Sodium/glutamate symporter n=1 Tax=Halomonas sp. H10-59 TaxID=2950874 RepID=A0AAU7KQ05_9GAMM
MNIGLNAVETMALALVLLMVGIQLRRRVEWLERMCVPTPVVGGIGFAVLVWLLRSMDVLTLDLDTSVQDPMMIAFFATVGLGGSLSVLARGGRSLVIFLLTCWALVLVQNGIGIGVASMIGLDPLIGLMAGGPSLEGGFGGAAAFGPEAEALGADGALTAAMTAATYGVITGSLLGAPLARWLIERFKLRIEAEEVGGLADLHEEHLSEEDQTLTPHRVLKAMAVVVPVMVIGLACRELMKEKLGIVLPSYVGAMFVAIVLRNLNDHLRLVEVSERAINLIGEVSLAIFLTMAMMNLKIWQLQGMGLGLALILMIQTLVIIAIAALVVFRSLGSNYDAAVLSAGFIGFGLGATPNAFANMGAVCDHYKVVSSKAYIIVPLCGAVLIDMVSVPAITWCLNVFA